MRLLALGSPLVLLLAACSGSTADVGSTSGPEIPPRETKASAEASPEEIPQGAFTGGFGGCSNVFLYRATDDGTQYAVVELDAETLGLTVGSSTTVDLGEVPAGVGVFVDVYGSSIGELPYCTDHHTEQPEVTRWTAEAGTLTIALRADPESTDARHPTYRATLVLETVHFTRPNAGKAIVVPRIVIGDVRVGWLPG